MTFLENLVLRLKSCICKGVLEKEGESAKKTNSNPSLEKEIAAAEFAQSSQEIFISKTEGML